MTMRSLSMNGCALSQSACGSSGELLPPRGRARTLPVCASSMVHRIAEAALTLKQGAGRLIRSEDDYGVVVICDPRMVGRNYGRVFLAALPPMTVTRDEDEARRFLVRHAPRLPAADRAGAAL